MTTDIHVLYVEDDAQSRTVMEIMLSGRMGLKHITIFENSTDFLERVNQLTSKPTVILLDIHVAPINGFIMLQLLRAQAWTKNVPIVAITASVMNEEVQQLMAAGFDGCLAKPLNIKTFPENMKRIIAGESVWNIV